MDSSGFSHLHPVLKLARSLSAEGLPYHTGAHGHTRVPNDVALGESGQGWGLTWAGCSPGGGWGGAWPHVLTVMMPLSQAAPAVV